MVSSGLVSSGWCSAPRAPPTAAGRRRRAEAGEEVGLLLLGGVEVARLDVPEALDLLRDVGEPDRDGVVVGVELADDLLETRLEVAHQLALRAALVRVAEHVERRAAQALEARQHLEGAHQPRPEAHLARNAGLRVLAGEQRRREVELVAQALAAQGEQAFPGKGNPPALDEELRRLRAEVKRLTMEREILKKATAFFARESS